MKKSRKGALETGLRPIIPFSPCSISNLDLWCLCTSELNRYVHLFQCALVCVLIVVYM